MFSNNTRNVLVGFFFFLRNISLLSRILDCSESTIYNFKAEVPEKYWKDYVYFLYENLRECLKKAIFFCHWKLYQNIVKKMTYSLKFDLIFELPISRKKWTEKSFQVSFFLTTTMHKSIKKHLWNSQEIHDSPRGIPWKKVF